MLQNSASEKSDRNTHGLQSSAVFKNLVSSKISGHVNCKGKDICKRNRTKQNKKLQYQNTILPYKDILCKFISPLSNVPLTNTTTRILVMIL